MAYPKIKEARKRAGITQKELAERLGITHATLSRYENGIIDPPSSQMSKIANALGVSTAYLMGWADAEQNLAVAGLSVFDIAEALNMPTETVQHIISSTKGESALALDKIIKVANLLAKQSDNDAGDGDAALQLRLNAAFDLLNDEGRQESVKRIEELAEIPRYRSGE